MSGTYLGSSRTELRQDGAGRRGASLVDPTLRLAHRGTITLIEDRLELEGWRTVRRPEVEAVEQDYLPEFGRLSAAGSRGQAPSLGFLQPRGAPVLVHLTDGETLVLLCDRSPLTGWTRNAQWADRIRAWAER